jgi:hypothetical protein
MPYICPTVHIDDIPPMTPAPALRAAVEARPDESDDRPQAGETGAHDADVQLDGGPGCGADVVPGYVGAAGDDVEAVEAEDGGYAAAVRKGEYGMAGRRDFEAGRQGKNNTHNPPTMKTAISPYFCFRGSCRPFSTGTGNTQIIRSVTMLKLAFENQNARRSMQWPFAMLLFQKNDTGVQAKMLPKSKATP